MVPGMYSYETYSSAKSTNNGSASKPRSNVGYFKLSDDGDEALVRFNYDSPNELTMAHVHDEPVGNSKHRRVLCLRENARDDMEKCPFCARGDKYYSKVYLKLIEYVKDETGKIVPQAKVWERPAGFADTVAEYINNYGGLKDVVFKVKRKGIRGSMETTYILTPMPSTMYNESTGYAKDFHEFDNFSLFPHSFLSKTKEEIEEYIQTGEFPFHKRNDESTVAPIQAQETFVAKDEPKEEEKAYLSQPIPEVAVATPRVEASTSTNQDTSNNPLLDRPRRRYDYN